LSEKTAEIRKLDPEYSQGTFADIKLSISRERTSGGNMPKVSKTSL